MSIYNYVYIGNNQWSYNSELLDYDWNRENIEFKPFDDFTGEHNVLRMGRVNPSDTFNITNNSKDEHLHIEVKSRLPIINFVNNGKGMTCWIIFQDSNEDYRNISKWNVSGLTDMNSMFSFCENFNQPLNNWDVSNVTNMKDMFCWCTEFDQPLNNWDVSNVTNMKDMFCGCNEFDQPLNDWDISNVTNMYCMFEKCINFNQPLDKWDVSNLTDMRSMFDECISFNQPLNNWNVSDIVEMDYMFFRCMEDRPKNDWEHDGTEGR